MVKIYRFNSLLLSLCILFIVVSCSSSGNTVVVSSAPIGSGRSDSLSSVDSVDIFQSLEIGENESIRTLDPLFIQNEAEMRATELIYEGLVRFDKNGKVVPAAARKWTISNNKQQYRFTLRPNLFYHDSNGFANGRGRRVLAVDIKRDFERMAHADVPRQAARLFESIKGFEPYFQEQHQLFNAAERRLKGVSGIRVPNDSTIVFSLIKPDDHFLQKLSSPFAVIYPQESIQKKGFQPVGIGPFTLSQRRSKTHFIFARFDNYYQDDEPKINRIDVRTYDQANALAQSMQSGDVQFIPQLSPALSQKVMANGQLATPLQSEYRLLSGPGVFFYFLQYNTGSMLSKRAVAHALGTVEGDEFFPDMPNNAAEVSWSIDANSTAGSVDSLSSTYSSSPFVKSFYDALRIRLSSKSVQFKVDSLRVRNQNTPLYVDSYWPMEDVQVETPPNNTMLTLKFLSTGLLKKNVNNVPVNQYPWWINLRQTTVSSSTNR